MTHYSIEPQTRKYAVTKFVKQVDKIVFLYEYHQWFTNIYTAVTATGLEPTTT